MLGARIGKNSSTGRNQGEWSAEEEIGVRREIVSVVYVGVGVRGKGEERRRLLAIKIGTEYLHEWRRRSRVGIHVASAVLGMWLEARIRSRDPRGVGVRAKSECRRVSVRVLRSIVSHFLKLAHV